MRDGFFVLDKDLRIIDYNQSVKTYINYTEGMKLIGEGLDKLLPNQPEFFKMLKGHTPGKIEFEIQSAGEPLFLEADVIFFNDNKINSDFPRFIFE